MPLIDTLGLGAAAVFGIGVGARAFMPIIAPAAGKVAKGAWKVGSFAARKAIWPVVKSSFKSGGVGQWALKSGGQTAWSAAKFAIRHPYMTAGAVGAGAYLATQTSPYDSPSTSGRLDNINLTSSFNQEQMAAQALQESGVAPMGGIVSGATIRNQRLMESTMGLTQGLHRSRH